ncbi:hypothetical protein ABEB36_002269 [Hypothenemus hampei]|uniref:Protein slender lobes n=1 Tax=Hypothenemus hampei TaxID=57062 RepID=A0ABD1F5I8_HYPHA
MSRKSTRQIDQFQNEDVAVGSPLRRSTRIQNVVPQQSKTDSSQSPEAPPARLFRGRRTSTQSVDSNENNTPKLKSEASATPSKRGRKPSITTDSEQEQSEKLIRPSRVSTRRRSSVTEEVKEVSNLVKKAIRGRRDSNSSEVSENYEEVKKTRSRRSSVIEDVKEASTPLKKATKTRRDSTSSERLEKNEEVKKTRGRRNTLIEGESETVKPMRLRRSSLDTPKTPSKTPVRRSRRNSAAMDEDDSKTVNKNLEEIKEMEVSIVITPLKKRKIIETLEANLDLSVINESMNDSNNAGTSPKNSNSPNISRKRLNSENEAPLTPRKSPRLSGQSSPSTNVKEISPKPSPCLVQESPKEKNKEENENIDISINANTKTNEQTELLDEDLKSKDDSRNTNTIQEIQTSTQVVNNRVPDVFKPKGTRYSFIEPMEVDEYSIIAADSTVGDESKISPEGSDIFTKNSIEVQQNSNQELENASSSTSLSILNRTITTSALPTDSIISSAEPRDRSKIINDSEIEISDILTIEETDDIVNIGLKSNVQSEIPSSTTKADASLVINNSSLERFKVMLVGNASSPVTEHKSDTKNYCSPDEKQALPVLNRSKSRSPGSPRLSLIPKEEKLIETRKCESKSAFNDNDNESVETPTSKTPNKRLTKSPTFNASPSYMESCSIRSQSKSSPISQRVPDEDDVIKKSRSTSRSPISPGSDVHVTLRRSKTKSPVSRNTSPVINKSLFKSSNSSVAIEKSDNNEDDLNNSRTRSESPVIGRTSDQNKSLRKSISELKKSNSSRNIDINNETLNHSKRESVSLNQFNTTDAKPILDMSITETENINSSNMSLHTNNEGDFNDSTHEPKLQTSLNTSHVNKRSKSRSKSPVVSRTSNAGNDSLNKSRSKSQSPNSSLILHINDSSSQSKHQLESKDLPRSPNSTGMSTSPVPRSNENILNNCGSVRENPDCSISNQSASGSRHEISLDDSKVSNENLEEQEDKLEFSIETNSFGNFENNKLSEEVISQSESLETTDIAVEDNTKKSTSENSKMKLYESTYYDFELPSDDDCLDVKNTDNNAPSDVSKSKAEDKTKDENAPSDVSKSKAEDKTEDETVKTFTIDKDEKEDKNIVDENSPKKSPKENTISNKLVDFIESKKQELDNSTDDENEEIEKEDLYDSFIDDMAEEGEEDTPAEDSNQIIDEGESIGSSDSEPPEEEEYDPDDSFICDEESVELLSGDEYDLDQEKKEKTSRIINTDNLSDEDLILIPKKEKPVSAKKSRIIRPSDDSSDEEETEPVSGENKTTQKTITDLTRDDSVQIIETLVTENSKPDISNSTEILNESHNSSEKRQRKSSLTIQENIKIVGNTNPKLSERINSLVESFCSTMTKGEISMNLSLEFQDSDKKESTNDSIQILSDIKLCPPISDKNDEDSNKIESNVTEPRKIKNMKRRLSKSTSEVYKEQTLAKKRKTKKKKKTKSNTASEDEEALLHSAEDLKAATLNIMDQLVTDVRNRPKRLIKPSRPDNANTSWVVTEIPNPKPSKSSASHEEKIPLANRLKFHPKDFKNRTLMDNNRVKRTETKKLLQKKGVFM